MCGPAFLRTSLLRMMDEFGFGEIVLRHFGYLISEYEFRVESHQENAVAFVSPNANLRVEFDAERSFEIDLELDCNHSNKPGTEPPFSLDEALEAVGRPDYESFALMQASTKDQLERCIARMAEVTRTHLPPFLKGDKPAYEKAELIREGRIEKADAKRGLEMMREELSAAWEAGDFPCVIRVLEPNETQLSRSEQMKLAYARQQPR